MTLYCQHWTVSPTNVCQKTIVLVNEMISDCDDVRKTVLKEQQQDFFEYLLFPFYYSILISKIDFTYSN